MGITQPASALSTLPREQKSLISLGSCYPQPGSCRRPQAGGGSLGDGDASRARAKAVTKQPKFTEQDEEPSCKAGLVQERLRSIAAMSHPLECGLAVWFWEISAIL
jgi:hypothetical protein